MLGIKKTVAFSNQAPQPLSSYSLGRTIAPEKLLYLFGQVGVGPRDDLMCKADAASPSSK